MAFSFLKKNIHADLILHNGVILTQDPDIPQAEAVACSEGKIITVGNYEGMENLISDNTEIVDLEGKYVIPGLISLADAPVMEVFKGKYPCLTQCQTMEEVADSVSCWIETHADTEIIFGFGYNERILGSDVETSSKELSQLLDQCCSDKPIVLLCENTVSFVLNSFATDIVTETAEEEMVQYITASYVLNLLVPFDFEILEREVSEQTAGYSKKGITSVLSTGAPDYFENLYKDILVSQYNEDVLNIRFFASYYMNRPLLPHGLVNMLLQRKTLCNELGDYIDANYLYLDYNSDKCPMDFNQQLIKKILEPVVDKGFNILIKADAYDDLVVVCNAAEYIRSKGYKNILAIQSDSVLSEDLVKELMYWDTVHRIDKKNPLISPREAAAVIGKSHLLGSISAKKLADMAVFDTDPFNAYENSGNLPEAVMTILNGKIIYR